MDASSIRAEAARLRAEMQAIRAEVASGASLASVQPRIAQVRSEARSFGAQAGPVDGLGKDEVNRLNRAIGASATSLGAMQTTVRRMDASFSAVDREARRAAVALADEAANLAAGVGGGLAGAAGGGYGLRAVLPPGFIPPKVGEAAAETGIGTSALAAQKELAALENVSLAEMVEAQKAGVLATREIAAIKEEIVLAAQAELGATGLTVASTAEGQAAVARLLELETLEGVAREDLVLAVKSRISSELEIAAIQKEIRAAALAQLRAEGRPVPATPGAGGGAGGIGGAIGGRLANFPNLLAGGFIAVQALGTVRSMVDEAQRAQVALGQLKIQMDSVGQANQFPKVRDDILAMSKASAVAVDQVTQLNSIMLGAFNNVREASLVTQTGLALVQVGGLSVQDVLNNLVAVTKSFGIEGSQSMNIVSDEVLHLHDVFGVSVKEIVDGVGNIAPLAKDLGLSFKETSTIIAGAAAVSGRSAQQTANEIGRALTQIQKNIPAILAIFDTPKTQTALGAIQKDLSEGNIGQVLIETIRNWDNLSKSQQNNFLGLIGGRREFASLAAALDQNNKIVAELDSTNTNAGRTAQALAEYHRSLSFQIKQAKEAFRQLGIEISQAGLGQALGILVRVGADLATVLTQLFKVFDAINGVTHGWAGNIIGLTLALAGLEKVLGTGSLLTLLKGGGEAGAAATAGTLFPTLAGAPLIGRLFRRGAGTGGAAAGTAATEAEAETAAAGAGAATSLSPLLLVAIPAIAAAEVIRSYNSTKAKVTASRESAETQLQGASKAFLEHVAKEHRAWTDSIEKFLFGPGVSDVAQADLNRITHPQTVAGIAAVLAAPDYQLPRTTGPSRGGETGQYNISRPFGTLDTKERSQAAAAANRILADFDRGGGKDLHKSEAAAILRDIGAKGIGPDLLKKIGEKVAAGDQTYIDVAAALLDIYNNRPSAKDLLNQGAKNAGQTKVDNVGDAVDSLFKQDPSEALKAYQAHRLTADQTLQYLQKNVTNLEGALPKNPNDSGFADAYKKLQEGRDQLANFAKTLADQDLKIADLMGQTAALKSGPEGQIKAEIDHANAEILYAIFHFQDPTLLPQAIYDATKAQMDAQKLGLQKTQAQIGIQRSIAAAKQDTVGVAQQEVAGAQAALNAAKPGLEHDVAYAALLDKRAGLATTQRDLEQSRLALQRVQHQGDPVAQANDDIRSANIAINAAAPGTAAWNNAQAQMLTAQRALVDANLSVTNSMLDYNSAVATAAGDSVGAAQIQLEKARQALGAAQQKGDKQAIQAANIQVVQQAAAVRDAALADFERNISFQLQMKQISGAQAIAQYRDYLDKHKDLTQQEQQQLLLDINNLQQQASKDLQWNIPTDIKLPTLYEVRRLRQSSAAGQGYNDNRQIQVQYNVYTPLDHATVMQDLANVIAGDNSRTGVSPRTYP